MSSQEHIIYQSSRAITHRRWLQQDDSNDKNDNDSSSSAIDEDNASDADKYIQDSNDRIGRSILNSNDVSSSSTPGIETFNGNETTFNDNMTDRFKYKVRATKQELCKPNLKRSFDWPFAHNMKIISSLKKQVNALMGAYVSLLVAILS
jgi:hypothetical protein